MRLQVREPAQRGKGVGLVGEAEEGLVAAESVVAVEPGGEAKAMDGRPEIVGRVADLGAAYRGGPGPVVRSVEIVRWQRSPLAADRGMDAVRRLVESPVAERRDGSRHRRLLEEQS
ncbi:MAG TPA: hypothetical protein VGI22_11005 [Xanthobacteraceae bacterium]